MSQNNQTVCQNSQLCPALESKHTGQIQQYQENFRKITGLLYPNNRTFWTFRLPHSPFEGSASIAQTIELFAFEVTTYKLSLSLLTYTGFNGIYAKLGIKSVFANPYNARAKVIERFFLEFQEEFEKMMTSYIGTSVENKPAWLKRGEKLHRDMHKKLSNNYIPTIQELIKYIDCWLDYHNSKPCPNNRSKTIQEMLNDISKENIDKSILNDLMLKTEARTINKHGITFLGMHYRSDYLLDLREKVFIKYSLFDLSKVLVYSIKGEFLCIARQVEKVHPMANHLGTVKDMEQLKQQIQKQQRKFKRVKKEFLKYFPKEKVEAIEIEQEEVIEIEKFEQTKTPLKRKLNFREQQMNVPVFNADYEKYEWLMKYGCTNPEQRKWLERYLNSDFLIYLYKNITFLLILFPYHCL